MEEQRSRRYERFVEVMQAAEGVTPCRSHSFAWHVLQVAVKEGATTARQAIASNAEAGRNRTVAGARGTSWPGVQRDCQRPRAD